MQNRFPEVSVHVNALSSKPEKPVDGTQKHRKMYVTSRTVARPKTCGVVKGHNKYERREPQDQKEGGQIENPGSCGHNGQGRGGNCETEWTAGVEQAATSRDEEKYDVISFLPYDYDCRALPLGATEPTSRHLHCR